MEAFFTDALISSLMFLILITFLFFFGQISEKDRKILDIDSELYEVKRQLQDALTSAEAEVKLVQLKVDQIGRENDELRGQKRELDAALRKLQSDNATAAHQVCFFNLFEPSFKLRDSKSFKSFS